ncbi:DUF3833 domain-containing protein [Thalassotalea sp. PLHSN55]|uniref:DUF3833 domain-containing protein n=1 Tax=Thalassotalea sp. PLHSN55 TaxID=3435888 RepID=UPI003F845C26
MKIFIEDKKLLTAFSLTLLVSSCSTDINHYQDAQPKFDVKTYFQGDVIAYGMVQDYQHKVTRRFCVEINGSWQGNQGLLAETFYFNDGEISYRNWQLTKLENGYYQGTAEDVVGSAYGQQQGFAFHWQYQLIVPVGDSSYQFMMDDWMYQLDEHRVVNRTAMKKLGLTVAEVTLFFDKQSPQTRCR